MADQRERIPDELAHNNQFDPAARASFDLANREREAAQTLDNVIDPINEPSNANKSQSSAEAALRDREGQNGFYAPTTEKAKRRKLKGVFSRRRGIGLLVGGGVLGTAIGLFMLLAPLKLTSMIENLNEKVSGIPEYAIGQRVEYLVTRWVAMKAMQTAYPGDENLVFCAKGGLLCHLGSTKYSAWFEKQLDAKFEKEGRNVRVVFNANGRSSLGGKASYFTMHLASKDMDSAIKGVEKELSHKEMRRHIKKMVRDTHGRNYFLRFLSKRMLFSRYGVKRFNIIPDKTSRKYADFKAKVRSGMYRRTVAKISPRMAGYLACLSGRDALGCKETLEKVQSDLDEKERKAQEELDKAETDEQREAARKKHETAKANKTALGDINGALEGEKDSTFSKIIKKQVVRKMVTGGAVVGAIDMIASLVGAIDNGVLETIGRDQVESAYVAFTFDEEVSPVLVNDQLKAGDLKQTEYLQLATEMFDGAEKSALFQAIYGSSPVGAALLPSTASASGYAAICDDGEGGQKTVALAPGELVCPERKIVQSYSDFTKYKSWGVLAGIADFWNSSVGWLLDKIGDFIPSIFGAVIDALKKIPGLGDIFEFTEEKLADIMGAALGMIFRVPDVGIDAPGAHNYEALAGGLMTTVNGSLEGGIDPNSPDTPPTGIGGAKLSSLQVAAITGHMDAERENEFRQLPLLAKLFDPTTSRSVASQVLPLLPTSRTAIFTSTLRLPSALLSGITTHHTHASSNRLAIINAMGVPWHGYSDPSVFQASPEIYTPEFCAASAKARADSYSIDRASGELVPSYKVADPCALERTVGGLLATEVGDTDSSLYLPEVDSGSGAAPSNSSGGNSSELLPEAQKTWGGHKNGQIPQSALKETATAPGHYLHPQAAAAFDDMNRQYAKEHNGASITISESYRDLATQQSYYNSGITKAPPGTSNHGNGLAIDLNVGGAGFQSPIYQWLAKNANKYGFINPRWARDRNDPQWYLDEPWHWEYARRVN